MNTEQYVGGELELFRGAANWKQYFSRSLKPFIGARVLEVGAGIGETTRYLCDGSQSEWLCLEPDPDLAKIIDQKITSGDLPACCKAKAGKLSELPVADFDTVVYIDVLEHIEDDRGEIDEAIRHLRQGGSLIILAPAHQWLFSEFDKSIGHFRRYDRSSLLSIVDDRLHMEKFRYLDSVGTFLSIANRMLLKQSLPTARQINFWDKFVVPISRIADPLTGYHFGKSLLAVFKK